MAEVPRRNTPISEKSAAGILIEHILPKLGIAFKEPAELILSQIWLESGRGSSMQNNNPGNITAGSSWKGDFWRPTWFNLDEVNALPEGANKERLKKLHALMLQNKAPSKFRSYESMLDGFADYAGQLQRNFKSIIEAAKTGDAFAFTTAIHDSGYAPDVIPSQHTSTIAQFQKEFQTRGVFDSLPKASAPADSVPPLSSPGLPDLSSLLPSESDPEADEGARFVPHLKVGVNLPTAVKLWQTFLNEFMGGETLKVDGKFGAFTRLKTIAYQSSKGAIGNGEVGRAEWSAAFADMMREGDI